MLLELLFGGSCHTKSCLFLSDACGLFKGVYLEDFNDHNMVREENGSAALT